MALYTDKITADMVSALEFPYLADKYDVYGVPKTVVNDGEVMFEGALPEREFVVQVLRAAEKLSQKWGKRIEGRRWNMDLTDEQWKVIQPLIPQPPKRPDGRGRTRRDEREVLNGILWILRTGAPWKDLPERYPPYQTCHRRFQEWVRSGGMERILRALAEDLRERGNWDLAECFIDGTFVIAKKGIRGGKDQAGQGFEDHGSGRQLWSSCRRIRNECYAA